MLFFWTFKILTSDFSLVHGQVNWKKLLVRSNKCTTRTTRTIDFATPAGHQVSFQILCIHVYRDPTRHLSQNGTNTSNTPHYFDSKLQWHITRGCVDPRALNIPLLFMKNTCIMHKKCGSFINL